MNPYIHVVYPWPGWLLSSLCYITCTCMQPLYIPSLSTAIIQKKVGISSKARMGLAIEGNLSIFERDPEKVHVRPVNLLLIVQARWRAKDILEDARRGHKLLCLIIGARQVAHDHVPAPARGAVFELWPEFTKVAETGTELAGLGFCCFFVFFQDQSSVSM